VIQCQAQVQDVDDRLAEEPKETPLDMLIDNLFHGGLTHAPRLGHSHRDIGIEP
jgi:hypothetical protein